MVTISKPLSAGQAQSYHREEFANGRENYYTEGDTVRGAWHGKLAAAWSLAGEVKEDQFARLAEGRHPETGEALVRHQTPREYVNASGERVQAMEHRAGWDATFSAPKSVSLAALVGGDERVREAHRESVTVALDAMERYVQARIGGNEKPETTGRWVAARFEHDSSRPVDGYAAPQLHTHVVVFNLTETENGRTRALQPRELYRTQQYGTAVYRSRLAERLQELGYGIERGRSGQPEIAGFTREYLERSSPRRREIEEHLAETGRRGAGAAQIAAHRTRAAKEAAVSASEMRQQHREIARAFGDQPQRAVETALEQAGQRREETRATRAAERAVSYARERNLEREAVADERALMRDALQHALGESGYAEVRRELERRIERGELIEVGAGDPARAFTTPEMREAERELIERMRAGQEQYPPLAGERTREQTLDRHAELSASQRRAVDEVLASRDRLTGLEGVAGAGKTTSLAAIREAAEREGYTVEGLAPTSRAAQKLEEAWIESMTLQKHLARGEAEDDARRLYVVDESSLASTKQMETFVARLGEDDRVLLVGDVRQHQAVEAGRPYEQLQEAGLRTARLEEIVRQKDPELKAAVEDLARGEAREAVEKLDQQGRVHEIADPRERLGEMAREYARHPEGTLAVSPDNASRHDLNQMIREELQRSGRVGGEERAVGVLEARQDMTGADRGWAGRYEAGDVVRYTRGSRELGIAPGEYARVERVEEKQNRLTVARDNGERTSYDPRRLQGVSVHREAERRFAPGDRVQFTAPYREQRVANRELGTVSRIERSGEIEIALDSGRTVQFHVREHPHLDHGYAVTSHSAQGQTADRVLVHADTERSAQLVNQRMAYVAVSRGRHDAHIYTNDKAALPLALSRDASHQAALGVAPKIEPGRAHDAGRAQAPVQGQTQGPAQGLGIGR